MQVLHFMQVLQLMRVLRPHMIASALTASSLMSAPSSTLILNGPIDTCRHTRVT